MNLVLLANSYRNISSRGSGMSGTEQEVLWWSIISALTALLAYTFGRKIYIRMAARMRTANLFTKLAEVNGLAEAEKELLLAIATSAELDNPSILFLRPSLVARQIEELPPEAVSPEVLASLQAKLWGE